MNLSTQLDFDAYSLALEIEKLPASEQQTKVSSLLHDYALRVQKNEARIGTLRGALKAIAAGKMTKPAMRELASAAISKDTANN